MGGVSKSKAKTGKLNTVMLVLKSFPLREDGIKVGVEELSIWMVWIGHSVTCYNRRGYHVRGTEFDNTADHASSVISGSYEGVEIKSVSIIEKKGLAAVSSLFFVCVFTFLGKYDVVHIHAESPAFFSFLPKLFGKKVLVAIHGAGRIIGTQFLEDRGEKMWLEVAV